MTRGRASSASSDARVVFFTVPKAFVGEMTVIQRNAIESWKRLDATSEVVLFGDDQGVREEAETFGCKHVPQVDQSPEGVPLLNDVLSEVQRQFPSSHYCFVNCDIVLLSDFDVAVRLLVKRFTRFLAIARRVNVSVDQAILFQADWEERLRRLASAKGTSMPLWNAGADFHLFTAGLFEQIPPFAVGRFFWDHWMMRQGLDKCGILVDMSQSVLAIHQNHEVMSGVTLPAARQRRNPTDIRDTDRNRDLAGRSIAYISDATHSLQKGEVLDHSRPPVSIRYWLMRRYGAMRRSTTWLLRRSNKVWKVYLSFDQARSKLRARRLVGGEVRDREST